jgi:DNA gyrase subunit A
VVYKTRIHELPDSKASQLGDYLSNILSLEPGEEIIKIHATDNYSGHFLFAYENGKMAKIPVSSYATKTNRKKLSNAYYAESPLVEMFFLEEDMEFAAFSSIDKVLVFNTSQINPKATRDSQGVWVLKSKKGSTLSKIVPLSESNLKDPEYYRANVPAIGCYLKEEDKEDTQMSLL